MLANKKRIAAVVIITAVIIVAAAAAVVITANQGVMRLLRKDVVISIAGDILLSRGVADAIEQKGASYPYEGVSQLFRQDDITIANLECPLTIAGDGAMKEKRFVFKADPMSADTLKSSGFDVLMLANNHTMDYMSEGLSDTMKALGSAGLLYAGAGQSRDEIKPCFIEKNGLCIGILAYSALPPEGFMYDGGSATIAYARAGFLDDMRGAVASAAAQCDFLLVYFHWGTEYRHDVGEAQIETAHAAVDSGASAVIGTHPHVLQGRETYKGAPIYYSIGNFVFDKQIPDGTDEAIIVQFTVGKDGIIGTNELPVVIEACQPLLAGDQRAAEIETALIRFSRRFK